MIEVVMADMLRLLVDQPEMVRVQTIPDAAGTTLRLHVAPGDVGHVIGKQGRTARSLRILTAAYSMKLGHRYVLDIVETSSAGADR